MRLTFPEIPTVADNMALSAATLNAHKSGLEFLLGVSHAPYSATWADAAWQEEFATTYQTVAIGYGYYRTGLSKLYYEFDIYQDSGNGTNHWYAQIGFYGDDDSWHWVYSTSGTDTASQHESGTHDLTSGELAQLTDGGLYQWRIQIKTDDTGYHSKLRLWQFGLRSAIADWPTSYTFVNTQTFAAEKLNDIRTATNKLRDHVPDTVSISGGRVGSNNNDHDSYHVVQESVYRYRAESLWCAIAFQHDNGYSGRTVKWRVTFEDTGGNSATIYESGDLTTTGRTQFKTQEIDLTAGSAATAISNASITLTQGNFYRVTLAIKKTTGAGDQEVLRWYAGAVIRVSDGTPDGGWDVPNYWAHGDTDVGATHMDKYWTDLTLLYTGGNEELWSDHPFQPRDPDDDSSDRWLSGPHRMRRLHYRCVDTDTGPTLHYGSSYASTLTLDSGSGWQMYDLENLADLPYGDYYWLEGALVALECDEDLT